MSEAFTIDTVVNPSTLLLSEEIVLESGQKLGPVGVQYETYGELNENKDNVVLIVHAFSGDAHAAGCHGRPGKNRGWWYEMIGPGLAFDTDRFFVICSNCLGGCAGTTGPGSINPATGTPYGMDFPVITIQDIVNVQKLLLQKLGINKVRCVAGGSMGGMQVLDWAIRYPEFVDRAIVLASTGRLSAQGLAFNAVGRSAIYSDPDWKQGQYYGAAVPKSGLAIARMIGHITYLSDESMAQKFGRKLQKRETFGYDFNDQFQVESYLSYQGDKFVERFDANSYIYLTKAMDYFDLSAYPGGMESALGKTRCDFLILSYSSDWLFPTYQSRELASALVRHSKRVTFTELASPYGHDSFLLEHSRQSGLIRAFLSHDRSEGGQKL